MRLVLLLLCCYVSSLLAENDMARNVRDTRFAAGFYFHALNDMANRTDIEVSLTYWIKELSTNTYELQNVTTVLYDDLNKMGQDFKKGDLDMVVASPLDFVMYFERELLADGFIGINDYAINLAIIGRSDLAETPSTYQHARLVLPEHDQMAEVFIDYEMLQHFSKSYQSVFSDTYRVAKHSRIILDLFFGKADFAVVYEDTLQVMTELNPQIGKKIKVLKRFPVKARSYAYFHRDYPYVHALKVNAGLFEKQVRGKQILQVFKSDGVGTSLVTDLEVFDQFYQDYLSLKAQLHE